MKTIMIALLVITGLYLFLVEAWFSYIAVMKLKAMRDDATLAKLGRLAKVSAYTGLGLAYLKDAILVLLFSVFLWTLPREFTLTAMLERLQDTDAGKWRGKSAAWVCAKLLNAFDEGGHC